jgi:NAD(P)H-hydrate epimerase
MYYATAQEMEELDKRAEENGLEIRQMMELAGYHMLAVFLKLGIDKGKSVGVVCGKGNKGGDGLSAARHLINNGWRVRILLLDREISAHAKHHLDLLEAMDGDIALYPEGREMIRNSDVLIDSLIGYHLDGPPRGAFKEVIELMNQSEAMIVSYDLPSGADATTGECLKPCVRAHATLTLALPKKIFAAEEGRTRSGRVFLADIGIPAFLYDRIHAGSRPSFEQGILELEHPS